MGIYELLSYALNQFGDKSMHDFTSDVQFNEIHCSARNNFILIFFKMYNAARILSKGSKAKGSKIPNNSVGNHSLVYQEEAA